MNYRICFFALFLFVALCLKVGAVENSDDFYTAISQANFKLIEQYLNTHPDAIFDYNKVQKSVAKLDSDQAQLVKIMLQLGVKKKPINYKYIQQFNLVATAIQKQNIKLIADLTKNSSVINSLTDVFGRNLLMFCIGENSNREIIEQLIKSGINLNAVDFNGDTAAHMIIRYGWGVPHQQDLINYLHAKGARLDVPDEHGQTVEELLKITTFTAN